AFGSLQLAAVAAAGEAEAAGEAAVAGAADEEGAADAEGLADALAEALADGLADGLAAAFAGRHISVSWPYLAKIASLITAGWFGPSRLAASWGPIFWMSGTWQVIQRSTTNWPLTWTLGKSCCTWMGKSWPCCAAYFSWIGAHGR